MIYTPCKDSDQHVHPCSLISLQTLHSLHGEALCPWLPKVSVEDSDQTDLSLGIISTCPLVDLPGNYYSIYMYVIRGEMLKQTRAIVGF